jgi:DNA-binding NtrC family response regulator
MILNINQVRAIENKPEKISQDPVMKELYKKAKMVSEMPFVVSISGEKGVEKEVFTHLLHHYSPVSENPLIEVKPANVNISTDPEIKSDRTGSEKKNLQHDQENLENLNIGTLLLDDFDKIKSDEQVQILEKVATKNLHRYVNGNHYQINGKPDSTNGQEPAGNKMNGYSGVRKLYQLNVIDLQIPPLRKRKNDLPLLSNYKLSEFTKAHELPAKKFSDECMNFILNYYWPGNLNQLYKVIERCAITCDDDIIKTGQLADAISHVESVYNNPVEYDQEFSYESIEPLINHSENIIISQTKSDRNHLKFENNAGLKLHQNGNRKKY